MFRSCPSKLAAPLRILQAQASSLADHGWCRLSRIWYHRPTYSRKNRNKSYYFLLNVGGWLGKVNPGITSPEAIGCADACRPSAASARGRLVQIPSVRLALPASTLADSGSNGAGSREPD